MNKNITATFEYIDPEIAEQFLAKNTQNRPLQKHHVKYLAKEMLEGRWQFNGDAIVFDINNVMRQGQHRMQAVIQTGLGFWFLVVRGIDPAAFSTMDCGKPRNGSDALALIGEKHTRGKAGALVWINNYYSLKRDLNSQKLYKKISPSLVLELHSKYPDFEWYDGSRELGCSVIFNVCFYIFSQLSQQESREFMKKIISGENLSSDAPELLLRNRLIINKVSKAKLSNKYIFALFIKAWNARRAGIVLKNLRFREEGANAEEFPIAI